MADSADGVPIVAVGRFPGDGDRRAELALLVDDAHQHVGLGRLLLGRLLHQAARWRLNVLDSYVLYDNNQMLRLLRSSGRPLEVQWAGGEVLSVQLTAPKGETRV